MLGNKNCARKTKAHPGILILIASIHAKTGFYSELSVYLSQ